MYLRYLEKIKKNSLKAIHQFSRPLTTSSSMFPVGWIMILDLKPLNIP